MDYNSSLFTYKQEIDMKEYEGIKRITGIIGLFIFFKFFYHLAMYGMPECFLGEMDFVLCLFVTLFFCFSLAQLGIMVKSNRHNRTIHYIQIILILIILLHAPEMPTQENPLDRFYLRRYNLIFFTTALMIFTTFLNVIVGNSSKCKKTA